ncbi:MAG: DUF151 domain-containing protein [Bacteroidales bacterium]|nr:DUF151 domain-containing protein [Bacteroidales bacterium]
MDKVELKVMGITYNPVQSGAYALLLREVNGPHRIPIVVGLPEAQSIAMRLENSIPPRPLSHDLMISMMHAYGISLEEVYIYKFSEGVFMSELKLNNGEREISLDSRTSDAIALALRTGAPIYTTADIVKKTGIYMEENTDSPIVHKKARRLDDMSVEELERRMQRYAEQEEYELAAEIQALIKKKNSSVIDNETK